MSEYKNLSEEDNSVNEMKVIDLDEEVIDVEEFDIESAWDTKLGDEEAKDESLDQTKSASKQNEEILDIKKEIRSWIITLGITFVCIFVLKNFVIINAMVPTGSMENTIMPDDQLFGNRLAYMFDEPARGDIIFFYFPDDETQKYVKRIIGLPGETVTIKDAKIYINGSKEPLEEDYLKEEWVNGTGPMEFEVPEGCYFVMGDNRNTSVDSRYWNNPYVAREKIIGEAGFIYYPFDRMGVVE